MILWNAIRGEGADGTAGGPTGPTEPPKPRGPTEPRGPAGPAGQWAQPGADQLHRVHEAPARSLRASQYVYAIGSYHYNWNTPLELLVVVTGALGETDHIIARIATDAGFPDVKAFNTAFRRTFGRTPSAYRRLLTADTDEILHQHYVVSRRDETVMRILRTWASRAAGGAEPCATASLLMRPSPVEEALELARTLTARLERMADGGPGA